MVDIKLDQWALSELERVAKVGSTNHHQQAN
jgi:hypothetical protein